jgi:hypothetical protein
MIRCLGGRRLRKLTIGLLVFALPVIAACSKKSAQKDPDLVCASKVHKDYDPTRMDECIDVCKVCSGGTTISCTTSCRLKGAN